MGARLVRACRALHAVLQRNSVLARLVLLDNGLSAECERQLAGASDVIEFKGRQQDAERGEPPLKVGQVGSPRSHANTSRGTSIASTPRSSPRLLPSEVSRITAQV